MAPLFQLIIEAVSPPKADSSAPFLLQAMTVDYDDFVGRGATGCIRGGKVVKGQKILRIKPNGEETTHTLTKIFGYRGLKKIEFNEAFAGDIVSISGVTDVMLGDTLCDPNHPQQLPPIRIDEPTLSINIMVNSSPFAGQDGKNVTFNKIKERLTKEKLSNISLKIEPTSGQDEAMTVYGRGELQLAVLLETMRREGLEFTVSKPQVILKKVDGVNHEPIERVFIETPEEYSGKVIEGSLGRRESFSTSIPMSMASRAWSFSSQLEGSWATETSFSR